MSEKIKIYCEIRLQKMIGSKRVYLYRGFDLMHGYGWFAQSFDVNGNIGDGFHRKSKFKAVRKSLMLNENPNNAI